MINGAFFRKMKSMKKEEWEVVPECNDPDTDEPGQWAKKVDGDFWYIDLEPDKKYAVYTYAEAKVPAYRSNSLRGAKMWANREMKKWEHKNIK